MKEGFKLDIVTKFKKIRKIDEIACMIEKQISSDSKINSKRTIINSLKIALRKGSRCTLFLLRQDEALVAFAFSNTCSGIESGSDYLWLNELYVEEHHRNKGIGSYFIQEIEKWAINNKIVYMACITGNTNIIAQNLYKKNGFEINNITWVDKSIIIKQGEMV